MEKPDQPEYGPEKQLNRVERRRERIRSEVQRNREGGHRVPTWVLAAVLALILAGWVYLMVTK